MSDSEGKKFENAFHDVLMVAFDISAIDEGVAHRWIMRNMPRPGRGSHLVDLDSWWVANDTRFDASDTDSAVFVKKGKQEEARKLLREHGLVE